MFRIFITSGIYYSASANILKAVQYVVIYGMSEMRCYNPEYLDLSCTMEEPLRSSVAKPLQGQLASRRDKILLGHCVCRSFNNIHRQNWLTGPDPVFVTGIWVCL